MAVSPTSGRLLTDRTMTLDDAVKPARNVWTDPMPTDRQEQVEFFRREGFLILRGVLSREELTELDNEINRMAENHQTLPKVREGFDLEPKQDPTRKLP